MSIFIWILAVPVLVVVAYAGFLLGFVKFCEWRERRAFERKIAFYARKRAA